MSGLKISGGNIDNYQILADLKKPLENSAGEKVQESQAAKVAESKKDVAAKAIAPSPAGVGATVDVVV